MGWLDRLSEEISGKLAAPVESRPAPIVHECTITVRNSNDTDPGEATTGYYTVVDGILQMVTANGEALGAPIALGSAEAAAVARSQTRQRWSETGGGFNRRLEYPRGSFV